MRFVDTGLVGAYIIEIEPREDDRGFNARTWCEREFKEHGLTPRVAQANVIVNRRKGTLRGMHYQLPPHAESKLFRVTRGAIHDVIIDLRPASPTYEQWAAFELTPDSYRMLYVPESFAQGFQTLEDDTEVVYQVSEFYTPDFERGIRHDDPAFGIEWPLKVEAISEKDAQWPDYQRVGASGQGPAPVERRTQ
jgi:dTDP-4-dehydrorhamnose 3,5-epimerase